MRTNNIATPKDVVKKRAPSLGRGIAIIMGILLTLSLVRNIQTFVQANGTIAKMNLKLEKLEDEHESLQKSAQEVQQDYFLEKQARDKLGYGKEGEIAIVLPPEEILRRIAPKPAPEEADALPVANWRKWVRLFF